MTEQQLKSKFESENIQAIKTYNKIVFRTLFPQHKDFINHQNSKMMGLSQQTI